MFGKDVTLASHLFVLEKVSQETLFLMFLDLSRNITEGGSFRTSLGKMDDSDCPLEQVPKDFVQPLVNRGLTCVQPLVNRGLTCVQPLVNRGLTCVQPLVNRGLTCVQLQHLGQANLSEGSRLTGCGEKEKEYHSITQPMGVLVA